MVLVDGKSKLVGSHLVTNFLTHHPIVEGQREGKRERESKKKTNSLCRNEPTNAITALINFTLPSWPNH